MPNSFSCTGTIDFSFREYVVEMSDKPEPGLWGGPGHVGL